MIKIDTEGGEAFILPAMKDYLLKDKPTLWLSFHDLEENVMPPIREILQQYKHVYNQEGNKIEVNSLTGIRAAYLVTDSDIPSM